MKGYEYLSYTSIVHDRQKFRQGGGKYSPPASNYEFTDPRYFRVLFHFNNGDTDNDVTNSSGLLATTWTKYESTSNEQQVNTPSDEELWDAPSAWSYLKLNGENARADNLRKFTALLYSIMCDAPWYFSELSGIDTTPKADERRSFTIKLMPDPYDHRISMLAALYDSIVYSKIRGVTVLPVNLRRFDMSVFLFSHPVHGVHTDEIDYNDEYYGGIDEPVTEGDFATIDSSSTTQYIASHHVFEFTDCEMSFTRDTVDFDNAQGVECVYKMTITYGNVYESEYNEFLESEATDMIPDDIIKTVVKSTNAPTIVTDNTSIRNITPPMNIDSRNADTSKNHERILDADECEERSIYPISIKNYNGTRVLLLQRNIFKSSNNIYKNITRFI